MIRKLLYIIILSGLFFAPVERADVGKLQPIELVMLHQEDSNVILSTDTGDQGRGETVLQALADMRIRSDRIVYLDTATCLLVTDQALDAIPAISNYLHEDVRLCIASENTDLKEAANYLRTHREQPTMKQWKEGKTLPVL